MFFLRFKKEYISSILENDNILKKECMYVPEKGLLRVSCNTFIKYMQKNIDDMEILRFIFTE